MLLFFYLVSGKIKNACEYCYHCCCYYYCHNLKPIQNLKMQVPPCSALCRDYF